MSDWLRSDGDGITLILHIQPGAKNTEIVGLHGDALKIRLASPPVDGKANAALIDFIGNRLHVGRANIEIISGKQTRKKRVRIHCNLVGDVVAQALLSSHTVPD